jgi:hypothetical protein
MTLQEYDLEFKPTNIIKGQGLYKLVNEAMESKNQLEEGWKEESAMYAHQPSYVPTIENSGYVGTGADPGFNTTRMHQQNPSYWPFQEHLRSR